MSCRDESPPLRSFESFPDISVVTPGTLRLGEASSFYTEGALLYRPENAGDSQSKTAWCEGGEGNGEGEWLELSSSCNDPIVGLQLINGFAESRVIFPQFGRVAQAKLTLNIDQKEVWSESVLVLDQMKKQYFPLPSYDCDANSTYLLRVEIEAVHSNAKRTCLSEILPVSKLERKGPMIERGVSNCRIKTFAIDHLRFFAGPGKQYAFLGASPIYPTRYGAPILHIVEHKDGWLRVDSVQRSFAEEERPAESIDPRWGGWVHSKQLSFTPLEAGLYQEPKIEAAVQAISGSTNFRFVSCSKSWVEIQNEQISGWSRSFCPEERGCF